MPESSEKINFNKPPYIMGILNVTPDSFSDGGDFLSADKAIERGLLMISQGADIIDIGGESSRPFSEPISEREEMERVIPVIRGIREKSQCPISIDTYKSKVALRALEMGVNIVNDISALTFDPQMVEIVISFNPHVVLMHMKGTPRDMQINPFYSDLWGEILSFFEKRIDYLIKKGIKEDKIILDPGIGFGKRYEDNIHIIKGLMRLKLLGFPVLIGNSRKSFIGKYAGISSPKERDAASLVADIFSLINGADIIRVHNVKITHEAMAIYKILREHG